MRDDAASELLNWYDDHARAMPWRIGPLDRQAGVRPDPYRVWLSEVMLQQTTVAAVHAYFQRFIDRWPNVRSLAGADDADVMAEWAGLGYYARARNLLKCARAVVDLYGGRFPDSREELMTLPGIGSYTGSAIAAIAFDHPETVVDGNVERVMARLFAIDTPLPSAKPEISAKAATMTPAERPGDYAQAVMDLGATICTPTSPACGICPWSEICTANATGRAAELPKKSPKHAKPLRYGIAYVGQREDGAWLLETRPGSGLLGGMLGWPGSDWSSKPEEAPPAIAIWHDTGSEVRHTFTHFHLRLAVRIALLPLDCTPGRGRFMPLDAFRPGDLPTVMRKVYDLASSTFSAD